MTEAPPGHRTDDRPGQVGRLERGPSAVTIPAQRRPDQATLAGEPTRPRRARTAIVVPLVLCAVAVVAALGVGASLLLRSTTTTTHTITAPDTVAGMARDTAREQRLESRIAPIRESFSIQFMGRLNTFVSAVYVHRGDTPRRPRGPIVFVGATVDTSGEARDFVAALESSAKGGGYRAVEVDPGAGARGVCLVPVNADAVAASCAWSTGDSVGQVVPTKGAWGVAELGALMRDVRRATETSTTVTAR